MIEQLFQTYAYTPTVSGTNRRQKPLKIEDQPMACLDPEGQRHLALLADAYAIDTAAPTGKFMLTVFGARSVQHRGFPNR